MSILRGFSSWRHSQAGVACVSPPLRREELGTPTPDLPHPSQKYPLFDLNSQNTLPGWLLWLAFFGVSSLSVGSKVRKLACYCHPLPTCGPWLP